MKRLIFKLDGFARIRLVQLLFLAFACVTSAFGYSVTAVWDPSPSPDVAGYNVYYGVSGTVTNKLALGNQTSTLISGLQASLTYFFYATATDGDHESEP